MGRFFGRPKEPVRQPTAEELTEQRLKALNDLVNVQTKNGKREQVLIYGGYNDYNELLDAMQAVGYECQLMTQSYMRDTAFLFKKKEVR